VIRTRAAVFDGDRLRVLDDVEVRDPGPGEVRVRVLASGICHSDLNVLDGTAPVQPPVVLGHEAAGVVEAVGDHVETVSVGDDVVVAAAVACGVCRACRSDRPGECVDAFATGRPPFAWRGEPVRAYANVASFAGATVVRAEQVVAGAGLPAAEAALVGCAVSTGYGVAANVAALQAGDTVVVFGVGGIGVNVLQTARLLGCARIVAVDVNPGKAEAAKHFGADEFVVAPRIATAEELVALVHAVTGSRSIDATVECSGAPVAIDAAIAVTGRGGTTALVGIPPPDTRATFDVNTLLRNRRIVGSLNGTVAVPRDFPAIVEHARRGELDLAAQVSAVWPLDAIDDAIAAVRAGQVVRAVLDHTA
jgi:S-(hydroxymethyl)glutathione dehydrogenase/alcohol dehydrogenase